MKSLSEIEVEQDRFRELWNKVADDIATVQEQKEFFQMQVDYWTQRENPEFCREGHVILSDNYCQFGHARMVAET